MTEVPYQFKGEPNPNLTDRHSESPNKPEPYIVSEELKKAVNLAIYLKRPLLLEGEAGCGKTRLAVAIAYELGLPFYRWNVRSTSKAQDGLYEYDAILRLHDVQTKELGNTGDRNPSDPTKYRYFGPLGKAFIVEDRPAVVLIDEIDKADVDFPNDLLTVLDDPWRFKIRETDEEIVAHHTPIVIITSNKEKGNLPAPFLRRCIYYYLEFPNDEKQLREIVEKHYQLQKKALPKGKLIENAIARFLEIRKDEDLSKKPGTSEFLDWLNALISFDSSPYPSTRLTNSDEPLPYRELLFKQRQDWQRYGA
jgi:MoxR-like ATPase